MPVSGARLAADGQALELELLELQAGYIYELTLSDKIVSRGGRPLFNRAAYYTANRLRNGETKPGPSKIAATAVALRAPDTAKGAEIFRLNCIACHQADGKGSKQVGTPDYTAPDSPLRRSDAELLAVIANGKMETEGKMMPPFGNVLSPQAIRDVLAYLRGAFLKPAPANSKK